MLYSLGGNLFFLHAGTSPIISQTVLTLVMVSFGVALVGIGSGYLAKSKEGLLQHRWMLSSAVVLLLAAIFFGMFPSLIRYYGDTDVEFYSALSGVTIIHAIIGAPAIIIATYYVFGVIPKKNPQKWMRWTAALWIASIVMGIFLFLQMLGLLPSMPGM